MAQVEFSKAVKLAIAKRAAYICSNPSCRMLTLHLTDIEHLHVRFKGRIAPICTPTAQGARFDPTLNGNQLKAIDNAIFLCLQCVSLVNRRRGESHPAALLHEWKDQHKKWVRAQLKQ
jgi:hypothetical protein